MKVGLRPRQRVGGQVAALADFSRFRQIDYEGDIFNAYYEIRP